MAVDMEFACKAATAGMQAIIGLIESGRIRYGLAIGSDTAQSKPHDVLEYTAGSGGASFLLGRRKVAVKIKDFLSITSDTPDFWRRDGVRFPTHAGRFTGEPAYFDHVTKATREIIGKTNMQIKDIDHCVFHMPNGKFPRVVSKRLGFSKEQLMHSLVVDDIGNPYAASTLLGFARVLDNARPGQVILMVSYGSGAGSDAFIWEVTDHIKSLQRKRKQIKKRVEDDMNNKTYINYSQYLKYTHKI